MWILQKSPHILGHCQKSKIHQGIVWYGQGRERSKWNHTREIIQSRIRLPLWMALPICKAMMVILLASPPFTYILQTTWLSGLQTTCPSHWHKWVGDWNRTSLLGNETLPCNLQLDNAPSDSASSRESTSASSWESIEIPNVVVTKDNMFEMVWILRL